MSRGFAAANVTASESDHVRPLDFVELALDSGVVRAHNGVGTFSWGGNDWVGLGAFLSMAPIEEDDDGSAKRFWVRLNAFDDAILAEALTEEVYKRQVTVYTGFLDDSGALAADPHDSMWSGFGDSMLIHYGDESFIALDCELEVALDHVPNGGRFNDEDQQRRFSGDTGFEFLDQQIDSRVHWGPGGATVVMGVSATGVRNIDRGGVRPEDRTRRTSR